MPRANTECTELSVGLGLLQINPIELTEKQIGNYFSGSLSLEKYTNFVEEFRKREDYYRRFYAIGIDLRNSYPPFADVKSVRWEGPWKQARSVSMAKDIIAANTSISIKANSHVFFNPSPYNLFVALPGGRPFLSRYKNWYVEISPQLYQELYSYVKDRYHRDFPGKVVEFHKHKAVPKAKRKLFAQTIVELEGSEYEEFNHLYHALCHDVAQKSATMFNEEFQASIAGRGRKAIIEDIVRYLFRLGDSEYILCGLDEGKSIAVTIPDLTGWTREWKFKDFVAIPDPNRGQSIVKLKLTFEDKMEHQVHELNYHVEIRWSHGKFCGNPEAKLYKEFAWTDVPFFKMIYEPSPIQKSVCIGAGGFGTVYEAFYKKKAKEKIAVKELRVHDVSTDERNRFEREVSTQSGLDHQNILPIIESNLSAMTPWFTMPLAHCNLAEIIDELPGNYQRIDRIFWQILDGIRYAHNQKVIHRDLKPENILLFDNELVKISDFGLCKRLDPDEMSAVLTHTSNNAMGTLPYAAPEQLESFRDADHRADIYALGKTLMHMATGKMPPITPTDLGLIDIRYRTFIEQCIHHNPNDRFQTVNDAIKAFQKITNFGQLPQLSLPF